MSKPVELGRVSEQTKAILRMTTVWDGSFICSQTIKAGTVTIHTTC